MPQIVKLKKTRNVGPSDGVSAEVLEQIKRALRQRGRSGDVLELGTLGAAYERIVKRQGLRPLHYSGGKIDLVWYSLLVQLWRLV